uniref:Lectin n=1 Tax=Pteroceltis tatarinowii TaxID=63062 RepID=A0AA95BNK0_9ROSA|nr:lectin [Pteroceltis tatarinowii]
MASQTIVVGPWGGTGGNAWDDGSYTGVRAIELTYRDTIGSFSVVYDLNGKPVEGPKHPGTHSFTTAKIELQFPEEYLVSVNGFYSPLSRLATRTPVIRSLTFKTNKRTFGPYGTEEGTPFSLPLENGLIVGFKGRTGELLDAIGFHLAL